MGHRKYNPAKAYVDIFLRNFCEIKFSIHLIHVSDWVILDYAIKTDPSHRI
jgi:hypothetical protein